LLAIEDLHAGYDGGSVLEGFDMALAPGEAVAILGRNGAGKTTLARTIMGQLRPRRGRIAFGGHDLTRLGPHEIACTGIGYVPQGRDIFNDMTVDENLHVADRARRGIDRAFSMFPALAERRRQRAGALSGGQQQQLAIARALVTQPKLLILDEPTEGVQPSVIDEIMEAVGKIVLSEGLSLILIEQNIDMALTMCSRAVFIDHGRAAASEPAADLLRQPGRVEQLMGF
jgi:ABC-type branched-subunit amino acid transport system ATPase component